jgi:hypothetical protein
MELSLKSLLPAVDRGWEKMRAVCALPECPGKSLVRYIPQTRTGIRVGKLWYCSADCFAMAARAPLADLCGRRVTEMPRSPRMSLGLVMLSKGQLTAEQLRKAVVQSEVAGEDLEAALVRLGLASEKQLTASRAAQWGYPVFAQDQVGHLVEADIPRVLLDACSAVPLHYSATAKRMLLGFVTRIDHSFLESMERVTGCRAEPCFITPTDFDEQMERITSPQDYEDVLVDEPGTPDRMARTVGRYAVEVGATEAFFTQCKGYVWVRVAGKRGRTDITFRISSVASGAGTTLISEESTAFVG